MCPDCLREIKGRGANARRCKVCTKIRRRMLRRRNYRENHAARERQLSRFRERYASDPEFKERVLNNRRTRYAEDPYFREAQLKRSRDAYRDKKLRALRGKT